jgi:hypothetical protein
MKNIAIIIAISAALSACKKDVCVVCSDANGAEIGEKCFVSENSRENWYKRTRNYPPEEKCNH